MFSEQVGGGAHAPALPPLPPRVPAPAAAPSPGTQICPKLSPIEPETVPWAPPATYPAFWGGLVFTALRPAAGSLGGRGFAGLLLDGEQRGGTLRMGVPRAIPHAAGVVLGTAGCCRAPRGAPGSSIPSLLWGGHGHILRGAGSTGTSSGSSWGPSGPAGALQPAVVAVTHPAPLLIPRLSGTLPAGSQSGCSAASLLLILTPHPPGFLPISPLPCVV